MDRAFRVAMAALPVIVVLMCLVLAQTFPGYFSNQRYLAGMIFGLILLVCLWRYDRLFFPFLMVAFLWAGTNVPMTEPWTTARWVVLGAGALVGFVQATRVGGLRYHQFHLAAALCVISAVISAMVSGSPQFSLLKALSLFLLFLFGSAGARLVFRSPDHFLRGLLLACELSVYVSLLCYMVLGLELWGNRNSLGAVEGVIAAPLLFWGALAAVEKKMRVRYAISCAGALYLVYFSITRAAMLAAFLSMFALLLGLRRNKLLLQGILGIICVTAVTAIGAPGRFDELRSSVVSGVIYKGHQNQGLLGSRLSPWQDTVRVIQDNPYFGSGFGTSFSEDEAFGEGRRLASTAQLREHGSSYLAIAEYVGLIGILPFALLILLLGHSVFRVFQWLRHTGNPSHYSVPMMMVVIAGLVHAGFEDWLFAVGYYMTVLFWTLAFLLADVVLQPEVFQSTFLHGMRFRFLNGATAARP